MQSDEKLIDDGMLKSNASYSFSPGACPIGMRPSITCQASRSVPTTSWQVEKVIKGGACEQVANGTPLYVRKNGRRSQIQNDWWLFLQLCYHRGQY